MRGRKRQTDGVSVCSSFPKCQQQAGLGQEPKAAGGAVQVSQWMARPKLPGLSPLLSGSALEGSWSQEPDIKPRFFDVGILTTRPDSHP